MPTTRTHTAGQAGPVTLDVHLTAGTVHVTVEDREHAEVTVAAADDSGPSADAVNNTTLTDTAGKLTARVPRGVGGGSMTIRSSGRGGTTVIQSAGTVHGGMIGMVSGDAVFIGGSVVVSGGRVSGSGGAVVFGGSPITISARLPTGSSLVAETTSADVAAVGVLHRAEVRTVSGDVELDGVRVLDVSTTSGGIGVGRFTNTGRVESVSGGIHVHAVEEATLRARTVSGDIRTSGARVDLDASTVSGRVRSR